MTFPLNFWSCKYDNQYQNKPYYPNIVLLLKKLHTSPVPCNARKKNSYSEI